MKTIIWDVDDVLNSLMRDWLDFYLRRYKPESTIHYDELTENPPHEVLSIEKSEYLRSLDEFRMTNGRDLLPNPEALEWFTKYGAQYHHIVLTAVPRISVSVWAEWVFRHFGKWIRGFHFIPSPRPNEPSDTHWTTKGEFLSWLQRGDMVVEDNPGNLAAASRLGLRAICMPQPWNDQRLSTKAVWQSIVK